MINSSELNTIIFTHYGYSEYLEYTLKCAKKTNKNMRLILLGDYQNKEVATKNGWEHFELSCYKSDLQDEFNQKFQHVHGRYFKIIKNGKDWLRYVFERWFYINNFIKDENINRFWHFDSDTMIVRNLPSHNTLFNNIDFTVQCNGTCLNGLINSETVDEFCSHICKLFSDKDFLKKQQNEFDTIRPYWAFTEMRAFEDYLLLTNKKWINLTKLSGDVAFDECICQEHSFIMTRLRTLREVKQIESYNGEFYGVRNGERVKFATINLSWVPNSIFKWVYKSLNGSNGFISEAKVPFIKILKGRVKLIINNFRSYY